MLFPLISIYVFGAFMVGMFSSDEHDLGASVARGVIWPVLFLKACWREAWK